MSGKYPRILLKISGEALMSAEPCGIDLPTAERIAAEVAEVAGDADEVLSRKLKVMDLTAITLARDSRIPVIVFSILSPGALTAWPRPKADSPLSAPETLSWRRTWPNLKRST
jgi:uridylate kinase